MHMGRLAALLTSGVNLRAALYELGENNIPAELKTAVQLGAPLIPLLQSMDEVNSNRARAEGELNQALAVPQATRKLLLWLPVFTLVLTMLVGLVSLDALLSPLSLVGIALGAALLLTGSRVSQRMLKEIDSEFNLSCLQDFSVAISSGLNLAQIRHLFPKILEDERVGYLTDLSQRTGAKLGELVQSEIKLALSEQLSKKISDLRKLSVRLLIPLGLTTLPAFMLFIIPPILVGFTK